MSRVAMRGGSDCVLCCWHGRLRRRLSSLGVVVVVVVVP